jgi:triosephosphate isomerase
MSARQASAARPRVPLVLGNWKMNGDVASCERLLAGIRDGLREPPVSPRPVAGAEVGVCPPYPYLGLAAARLAGSGIGWGAQDVSAFADGAFTGEVSAAMLTDLGCTWTLVGHSERRMLLGDTDAEVARKTARALAAGLVPVVCVGETLQEREADATRTVLARQLDAVCLVLRDGAAGFVVAYEPVWAIGTGLTASPEQAQSAHAFIRARLGEGGIARADTVRILYGGSVKPSNAGQLFGLPDVDGGLIGGASLSADDFLSICRAADRS